MAKILNLARLQRKMNKMPQIAKAAIREEMEAIADRIVSMMRSLVPKKSGALRDSIGWTWGKPPKGAGIVAVAKASLGGDMTITIYAGNEDAFYARWVEFGHKFAAASPYFYVSWRANKKEAQRGLRKGVRKAAKLVANSS